MNIHILKNIIKPRSSIRQCAAGILAAGLSTHASADTFLSQNFSSDPVNYTLPGNSSPFRKNGNDDFWAITGTLGGFTAPANITAADGPYLAVQDLDGGLPTPGNFASGTPAQIDFTVDVAGSPDLKLSVALAGVPGAEPVNFLRAKTDTNGDGTYETPIFNFTTPGADNQPYTDMLPGSTLGTLTGAFQTKSNIVLPPPTAPDGNLRLRFEFFNDSGSVPSGEATGIDSIVISGTPVTLAADMRTFTWGGYTGVIDQNATPNRTVTLHVPSGTPLNPLNPNPTFTKSYGATCDKNSGGTGEYDFSNSLAVPLDYTVTSSDSAISNTYKVTVLADIPNVTLEIDSSTLVENAGVATVTARLSAATSQDVTVNLAFAGTASNLTDYTRSATSIVIPATQTSGFITLTGAPDSVYEPSNETIIVDISTVVNGIEATAQQVTATILDTPAADFLTFTWNGYNGVIDKVAQTVKLYVVHTTAVNPLDPNPSFTLTNGATCTNRNNGGTGVYDFSTPLTYTIAPSEGTPKDYTVTVYPVLAGPGEILPVPADLNPGDSYRLVFVTSTETYSGGSNHGSNPPWFTTVADYDAFATTTANAVPALAALSTPWKAIISTRSPNSDARDNTGTNPSSTGVPIYQLSGRRVADNNADLWDGTIQNPINVNELGGGPVAQRGGVPHYTVWTGANANGTNAGAGNALINQDGGYIMVGRADATDSSWITGLDSVGVDPNARHTDDQPIYAISGILTVPLPGTDLLSFIWGSHLGVIDQNAKTVSLTVPFGTDLTTINPACTFSSGATVSPASGANAGFTPTNLTVTYTVTSGGSHTDYAATVTVEPASSACDMLTFKSGSYSGGIGGTNVTLMVPLGTNVTALSPTYTVSPGATEDVSYPSGSTRDFTTPQSYTITAQDGTTTKTYTVSVLNVPITVPRGLAPGDQYRLVFVTSTQTYSGGSNHGTNPPWFTSAADYNAFATAAATAAPELSALGATTWKAIVSSSNPAFDARDNTATNPSTTGVPIYNLAGVRVANNNADLWDATIQNPINITELGGLPPVSTFDGKLRVWTGTNQNGTNAGGQGLIWQDGGWISNGLASSTDGGWVWGNYDNAIHTNLQSIYAISDVLTVPAGGSAACNLVSFNHGTAVGVITPGTPNTVLLTIPYGDPTPLTALTPAVTPSAFATFTPTGAQDFTNSQAVPVDYTVTAEDGITQKVYQVTVVKAAASTACEMVSFEAAGVSGVITPGSPNTVTLTLPPDTPVSALTPTVVVSPLATYAPTGPQDFTNSVATPVPYTVTAESGATQIYQVTISVASRPPNDDFVNAIDLPGASGIQTGTGNQYATLEPGEPGINGANNTVWFKWTAPSNGDLTISTAGSTATGGGEWDAMLGIYTGTSVDALTALPGTPQDTGYEETMTVAVTAGTTYHIQAAGFENAVASNIRLTWTFVGSGGGYSDWATTYAGGQTPDLDYNNDGVANGVAYFMGMDGLATNPGVVDGTVTWPVSATFSGTYEVQTSPDLGTWTPVDPQPVPAAGNLTYTLPAGAGKLFVRLLVTPN